MARYARRLTKQELIDGGIYISPDNRVFKNDIDITDNMPLNPNGYKILFIYDRDKDGNCIKMYYTNKHGQRTYNYKQRTITLNRALLAWYAGEVPEGLVSDHIDNVRDNYNPKNLQPLTPEENVNKNRKKQANWYTREMKCNMHKPREFYEKKLKQYEAEYNEAKYVNNAEKAHYLRSNISQTRARIRYWDSHKAEYDEYVAQKSKVDTKKADKKQLVRDRKLLAQWKEYYKEKGDTYMWHLLCKVIKNWDNYDVIVRESIFATLHVKIGNINTVGKFSDEVRLNY